MKKILIFEPQSGGHRDNFFQWLENAAPEYSDCQFVFFTDDDAKDANLANLGWWKKQKTIYQLFRNACRIHQPDHALILELTPIELPLVLFGSPVPLSAILFVQYPELSNGWKKVYKHWKTRLLLWRAPVKNLFLLNGEKSCRFLTRKFTTECTENTEGFQCLENPLNGRGARRAGGGSRMGFLKRKRSTRFIPIPDPAPAVLAEENFKISKARKKFLFFGAISKRKGADVLLDALRQISPEVAQQSAFIFCGKPEASYQIDVSNPVADIRFENGFVSNERMMALFEQADVILMPYTRPEYSSGILSIAAKAGTPVLGPTDGLLGRLIRENGLGATTQITPAALAEALARPIYADPIAQRAFAEKANPVKFAKTILDSICNES